MHKRIEFIKTILFGVILLGFAGILHAIPVVGPDAIGMSSAAQASPSQAAQGHGNWDAAARIKVSQKDGRWTILGAKNSVTFDPAGLVITVRAGSRSWQFLPSSPGDLTVKSGGAIIPLRLADAPVKSAEPYKTGYLSGIKITLSGYAPPAIKRDGPPRGGQFPSAPTASAASAAVAFPSATSAAGASPAAAPAAAPLDIAIQLFIGLDGRDEDLAVRLIASDGADRVRELVFPPSLDPSSFDHTVVPTMQGMLLPKAWPRRVVLNDEIAYGRGLYMPWWGHQQQQSAIIVILETPADAGIRFAHPAGGPSRADVRWLHSLGRWSYPRSVRYAFIENGGYVALAKRYRRYAIETGNFVSLKEKIARNPLVARLVGAPVIHTSILYHIQPDSSYYKKDDPKFNHQLVTFDERIAELRRLAARGVKRAYLHLDGWGFRGYDNLHPDYLPPSPEGGGWEGMKRFADACDELGIVFAVHDQYRDYYMDAPSYDPRHTVMNEDGTRPEHATWYGGRQSILCSSLAPGYVRRNFGELLARGVKVRGAYLDVFSIVPGDECYSPEHPVTRAECFRYRGECLDFIRSFGGVVSSEEPDDWAIPHLDLVHHAPHALDPNPGHGPAMGIPVPLYSLVYHDALLVPWSLDRGSWGIPETDLGFLYGMGNAGLPYLPIEPTEDELAMVRAMCALHERVGLLELVKHEFLGGTAATAAVSAGVGAAARAGEATGAAAGAKSATAGMAAAKETTGAASGAKDKGTLSLWAPYRKQRFTYADGTAVTIDFTAETYAIAPPLK